MGTPARYYSSTAVTTTLSSTISASDAQINVASSSGFPSSYVYTLILEKDSANEEIVTVTGVVGSALNVTRGVDGTSARSHTAGTSVEHGVSALDFTDARSHQAAAANVHDIGSSASVVGTDTTQTLTNKTLTSTTLGGDLAAGTNKITGLGDPASAQDAATKNFVETGVTSQVVAATTQATNAATSATASAASASAASTSSTASANSSTASANSSTTANSSQVAAASSETNAAASAAAALASQNSATSSAASATSSASSATASQSASATSETNAAASAVAAAASAASAAATYDQFDDRFLGVKTSNPSLDNDGNALVAGSLFFNSTDNTMYVYSGSSWLAVNTGTFIAETLIDAKGDLVVGSANDTAARLAVGTDGFVLTADAAEATGVKWAASSGGGGSSADIFLLMGA